MRLTPILLILLLLLSLCLLSCDDSNPISINEQQLNDLLYNIKLTYDNHDITSLMSYYHPDYYSSGQTRIAVQEMWLDRMAQYSLLDYTLPDISVRNDRATLTFTLTLTSGSQTLVINQPADATDLSYALYSGGHWLFYGNQHSSAR